MKKEKLYKAIDKENELSDKDKRETYFAEIEYEKHRQKWEEERT